MQGALRTLIALVALLPTLTLAQSDTLRAQIEADLAQDPRTAQMSSEELSALVDALVSQAEEEGTAATYLESKASFDYASLFPPLENPTPQEVISAPIVIALLSLLGALLAVLLYMIHQRKQRLKEADLQNLA